MNSTVEISGRDFRIVGFRASVPSPALPSPPSIYSLSLQFARGQIAQKGLRTRILARLATVPIFLLDNASRTNKHESSKMPLLSN